MNEMAQGLYVFVLGYGGLFIAMALVSVMILLLERLFRTKPETEPEKPAAPIAAEASSTAVLLEESDITDERLQELAVAMAVAMALVDAEEVQDSTLGQNLEKVPGPWWQANPLRRPVLKN